MNPVIFPKDVWPFFFQNLPPDELVRNRRVCTLFRDLIGSPRMYSYWKNELKKRITNESSTYRLPKEFNLPNVNWKVAYCKHAQLMYNRKKLLDIVEKDPNRVLDLLDLLNILHECGNHYTRECIVIRNIINCQVNNPDPEFHYRAGRFLYQCDGNNTLLHIETAAQQDHAGALFLLGKLGRNSIENYHKAASLGNCEAMYELSRYYDKKDNVKALAYSKLAAQNGIPEACHALATYYMLGHITKINLELAFYYYKIAADKGYNDAQFMVGVFYYLGIIVEKNEHMSTTYMNLAQNPSWSLLFKRLPKKPIFNAHLWAKNNGNTPKAVISFFQKQYKLWLHVKNSESTISKID